MKFNKKLAVAVSGAVLLMAGQFALADSTTDIVDALVSKGVLTEEEGKLITKGAQSKAKADEKANKARVSVGSFIDNATLYGDIRVRYEHRDGSGIRDAVGVLDHEQRERGRYKLILGAKTESGNWYSDLAFAMGAAGRSDNATFAGASSTSQMTAGSNGNATKETLYVKRAMLGYKPTEWLSVEAGRIDNPLYTTPMVWDADLQMEGLSEKVKLKFGNTDVFLTAVQSQYVGDRKLYDVPVGTKVSNTTNELLAFQGGVKFPIQDNLTAKAAVTYTYYTHGRNLGGTLFSPALGTGINGTANNTVNDMDPVEIPFELNYMATSNIGVRAYGDWVKNMSADGRAQNAGLNFTQSTGNDDQAWLLGFVVGQGKDLKAFEGNKLAKGDWQARVWYQETGIWALDQNAVDSDIFDSRINMKGTILKAQYNFEDNVFANLAIAHGSRKNQALATAYSAGNDLDLNLRTVNLFQADLTYKF